jgi:uncharacterized membrane protein
MHPIDTVATALVVIGGLNWGSIALTRKDLVATLFGEDFGDTNTATRVVYGLVGAAAAFTVVRFALGARRQGSVNVEESVEVDVPIRTAYDQWTQFEEFPRFMEGIEEIRQLGDTRLHWVARVGGIRREWDAEITEQRPDERVAWRSTDGAENAGVVTFHRISDDRTRVTVQLGFTPRGPVEVVGQAMGAIRQRTQGDLDRFKTFIEGRGRETGAWRGEVARPDQRAEGAG